MRWTRICPCCFVDRKSSSPWFFLFISVFLAFLLSLIIYFFLFLEVKLRALLYFGVAVLFDLLGWLSLHICTDMHVYTQRCDWTFLILSPAGNRSCSREVMINIYFPLFVVEPLVGQREACRVLPITWVSQSPSPGQRLDPETIRKSVAELKILKLPAEVISGR